MPAMEDEPSMDAATIVKIGVVAGVAVVGIYLIVRALRK